MIGFIDTHRDVYGVEPITRLLPIASSTYHEHARRAREPQRGPVRQMRDAELSRTILRVHTENFGAYGRRKVWRHMLREGTQVARCTVARLMRHMGLKGVVRGKVLRGNQPENALPRLKCSREGSYCLI
jgi:putative transposase